MSTTTRVVCDICGKDLTGKGDKIYIQFESLRLDFCNTHVIGIGQALEPSGKSWMLGGKNEE